MYLFIYFQLGRVDMDTQRLSEQNVQDLRQLKEQGTGDKSTVRNSTVFILH